MFLLFANLGININPLLSAVISFGKESNISEGGEDTVVATENSGALEDQRGNIEAQRSATQEGVGNAEQRQQEASRSADLALIEGEKNQLKASQKQTIIDGKLGELENVNTNISQAESELTKAQQLNSDPKNTVKINTAEIEVRVNQLKTDKSRIERELEDAKQERDTALRTANENLQLARTYQSEALQSEEERRTLELRTNILAANIQNLNERIAQAKERENRIKEKNSQPQVQPNKTEQEKKKPQGGENNPSQNQGVASPDLTPAFSTPSIQNSQDLPNAQRGAALIKSAQIDLIPITPANPGGNPDHELDILGLPMTQLLGRSTVEAVKKMVAKSAVGKANQGYDLLEATLRSTDPQVSQIRQEGLSLYGVVKGMASVTLGSDIVENLAMGRVAPSQDRDEILGNTRLNDSIAQWKNDPFHNRLARV